MRLAALSLLALFAFVAAAPTTTLNLEIVAPTGNPTTHPSYAFSRNYGPTTKFEDTTTTLDGMEPRDLDPQPAVYERLADAGRPEP